MFKVITLASILCCNLFGLKVTKRGRTNVIGNSAPLLTDLPPPPSLTLMNYTVHPGNLMYWRVYINVRLEHGTFPFQQEVTFYFSQFVVVLTYGNRFCTTSWNGQGLVLLISAGRAL